MNMRALGSPLYRGVAWYVLLAILAIAGCAPGTDNATSAHAITDPARKTFAGSVSGGQQPVSGANVMLLAVGESGDGSASTSLMSTPVYTDSNGDFTLTGDYTCPVTTPTFAGQVYLVSVGGNPGLGPGYSNPNLVLMAALGLCGELTASTNITMNEQTTVASVAALAPFTSGYTAIGSGSSDASSLDAAMNLVNELVNTTTGSVPGPGLPAGYTAPSVTLATLADAISACVNSPGGSSGDGSLCGQLFLYATPPGGDAPKDTVGAILDIVNYPTNNVADIFSLVPSAPPYQPSLVSAPSSWALPVLAPGNGTLTLAASSYSVNEDAGAVVLLVTRTEGDTGAVSVSYATANGTANAGTDFTATTGALSWSNGDFSAKTISVPITDAMVYGGTRTFTVSLSSPTGGANLGVTSSSTVTIDDSDVQASYYVATSGNDTSGTGTLTAPFATLARAQSAMRATTTKVTQIESGTYYLAAPLALTSADDGETWEAAPGATPVISGGVPVTGWTSIGGGIWTAPLSSSAGIDLDVNGVRQYAAAAGWDPLRPYMSGWHVINYAATTTGQVMNVYAADLTASAQTVGAILQYTDTTRYTDWFGTVSAFSTANDTVTIAGSRAAPSSGQWRVLGDYRDVTVPGQFGYNPTTKQIYLMTTSSCGFGSNSVAISAQLGSLITVSSVSNLTISGLTFSDTVSARTAFTDYSGVYNALPLATIQGNALTNSSITGNAFTNVGNGISLTGSTGNSIGWNTFDQLGGTAIFLKTQSNKNTVQHNSMTNLGRVNAGSQGIYLESSASVTVDSNYLNGVGRNAINVAVDDTTSTSNLVISNNVFINTSQQTNDTAGIYLYAGNNSTQVNIASTVTGNRVENTGGLLTNQVGQYVFAQNRGIYNDDKVSGVTVTNNVTENNFQGILLCHGCTGNAASNNVAILQSQPTYANYQGTTSAATGAMMLNGTMSINLLPSYFPAALTTSVIVVQMSGASTVSVQPQFNVMVDGGVIGSGTVSTTGTIQQFVYRANLTPRAIHQIGVQLTNGANSGTTTQSLANMALFINNTFVNLAAGNEYGMQILSDSTTNEPNVSNFSYNQNIVYRLAGAGQDVSLAFNAGGYTDANPGTIDNNLLWKSLTKTSSNTYLGYTPDVHSLIQDPLFLNINIGDYTLNSASPALGLGFTVAGVPLAPASSYPATVVAGCTVY